MSAVELARAIADLETGADLIVRAVNTLSAWDATYDGERERRIASELYYKSLALRLLLETEVRERVMH